MRSSRIGGADLDGVAIGGDENADEGTQTRRVDPVVVGDHNRWLVIGVNNSDSTTLHFFLRLQDCSVQEEEEEELLVLSRAFGLRWGKTNEDQQKNVLCCCAVATCLLVLLCGEYVLDDQCWQESNARDARVDTLVCLVNMQSNEK